MHEVPAQHKIEHTAGTKPLTKKEKKLFLEHGPLKSGVFTPNEDKIIKDNWKAFCEVYLINFIYFFLYIIFCIFINVLFYRLITGILKM